MRKLSIIGIGAGNPDHITVQAIKALSNVDVTFLIGKGEDKEDLAELRKDICARHIKNPSHRFVEAEDPARDRAPADYEQAVTGWHAQRAAIYERMIREELGDGQHGAFLVWGDPSLYDSTLRIVDRVLRRSRSGFEVEVIPGVTSVQVLAARHRIVLNRVGEPVLLTTGRRLREAPPTQDAVVMLDAGTAFDHLDPETRIWWGAYLGLPDETLLAGTVGEVGAQIRETRTALRERKGWIMDTYLLRPPPGS